MKQTAKWAGVAAGAFAVFVALSFAIQRWIVYPQFEALEKADVVRSEERLTATLDRERGALAAFAADYAEWDDTWAFMATGAPEFLDANFAETTFHRGNIQRAMLVRADRTVLFDASHDLAKDEVVRRPAKTATQYPANHPLLRALDGKPVRGLLRVENGPPLLAVAHPVLMSDGRGPARGVLIFGRDLGPAFAASLSNQLQVEVDVEFPRGAGADGGADRMVRRRLNTGEIESRLTWTDVFDEPAVSIVMRTPSQITNTGRRALAQSVSAVVAQGLLFLAFGLVMAWRTVRRSHHEEIGHLLEERTAELRDAQQYLGTIMDTVPAGIIIVDASAHRILDANPAALQMTGAAREEMVGRECHAYICPVERGRCPISDLGATVDRAERKLLRVDGSSIPVLKTVVPIHLRGRDCLLECFVDIRDRKDAEERIRQSVGDLERMNRAMVGREERVLELKREVNALRAELGRAVRYREGPGADGEGGRT